MAERCRASLRAARSGTPETESEGHAPFTNSEWLAAPTALTGSNPAPNQCEKSLITGCFFSFYVLLRRSKFGRGHFIEFEQRPSLFPLSQAFQCSHAPKLEVGKPHPLG
jgi:hypothetical protein